ncbi:hypothetical protein, partial [Methylobacterium sp. GC_Met_3]|uniref:hypothetical protein n=1 Tax=Methylobacterium sp. GC_Met_3 TaxID=2937375 RepID=UPI00226A41FD
GATAHVPVSLQDRRSMTSSRSARRWIFKPRPVRDRDDRALGRQDSLASRGQSLRCDGDEDAYGRMKSSKLFG